MLWVGEEDFMASSQELERTSSSMRVFFLGIVEKIPEEKTTAGGEYKLEWIPNLDSFIGAGSVSREALWSDLRSIKSRLRKIQP